MLALSHLLCSHGGSTLSDQLYCKTIRQRTLLFDISAKEATEQGPSPPAQRHVVPEGQALVYITEASQA